ncbi:MAG: hypothetical protein LBI79_02960 [Nitrososphaerota archaeon]|nr:hypothetical protein [Nitrososphaerota archaeon]
MTKKTHALDPEITSEGKYICKTDNRTFNTREDYDRHCIDAHLTQASRAW